MTRTIVCDVCGEGAEISNADDYFVLQIPHRNLEEEIDEPLVIDVCSLKCLDTVVESLQPGETVPQPTLSDPEPETHGRLRPQNKLRADDVIDGVPVMRYEGDVTVR